MDKFPERLGVVHHGTGLAVGGDPLEGVGRGPELFDRQPLAGVQHEDVDEARVGTDWDRLGEAEHQATVEGKEVDPVRVGVEIAKQPALGTGGRAEV
jgi:hypothetical protein